MTCKILKVATTFCLIAVLLVNILYAETIKIVTYNLLNFPDALGMQRLDDFRLVIDYVEPDILVVQEMQSQFGVDLFLDSIFNYQTIAFSAAPFNDGPDTDNSLFYRPDNLEFISTQYITTPSRDIAQYNLCLKKSHKEFYIFSVHFKSAQGSENEAMRLQEATILRNHLDSLNPNANFLVMGDFNFYYDEPGFHKLIDSLANNRGRLFDPLFLIDDWHDNSDFSYTHSQSSRLEDLPDGGASGGLDDRFDMILCSQNLLDTAGLYLLKDSYTICGNDANHFNKSVNYGINQSVPDDVADALYYASDHLPVFVNIIDNLAASIAEVVLQICPNPMQNEAQIRFPWLEDFARAKLTITNILGQRVYETETTNPQGITIKRNKMPVGIYFVHLQIETRYNKYDYRSKLAVVK